MYGWALLYVLTLAALSLAAEQRKLHRLVGGHHKIVNLYSDDTELMRPEASGSRGKKQKSEQEEKKTLAQQVVDGKYGLIQKELFTKAPKKTGVLTYEDNPEVPQDNKNNLGGLNKNEIWLAENHLLVLRGGIYPPYEEKYDNAPTVWSPIDNFKAPLHQVKIPAHPKVPPPFPVQFTDDGPLQILGTNSSRTLNDSVEPAGYTIPSPNGYQPDTGSYVTPGYPYSSNATPWQAPLPIPLDPSGEYPQGVLFPPFPLNGTLPPYFGSLPPGAAILPPPENQTDLYDEDDPSIYYPPPYSFYYPKDNSSIVPPGPLVPGIILPPPPNFFAPLEETTITPTTRKSQSQRKPYMKETNTHKIDTTTTPIQLVLEKTTTKKPLRVYPSHDPYYTNEIKPTVAAIAHANFVTVLPARAQNRTYVKTNKPNKQNNKPQITILRPVKPNTAISIYGYENEIADKPYAVYGPPETTKKHVPTVTQMPRKYYSTSSEIEMNSVTQIPLKFHVESKTTKSTVKPAQYFFYEEQLQPNSVTTERPTVKQNSFLDIPKEYYLPVKPTTSVRQRKPQYIYVSARPYNTQKPKPRYAQQSAKTNTFSIHIARLQNQINQYYTTPKPTYRAVQSPKPVYQFSFQAANYQSQHNQFKPSQPDLNQRNQFRPLSKYSVQIQQAIEIIPTEPPPSYHQTPSPVYYQQTYQDTTERPGNYYTTAKPNYRFEDITQNTRYFQNVGTPRPIAQYSYKVTPNPINQGFYTKPDESYFDENTKQYFTMFGKKLPSSTSPVPIAEPSAKSNFIYTRQNQQQSSQYNQLYRYQKPISLEHDTIVNYVNQRPAINPDSELVPVDHPNNPTTNYPETVRYSDRPVQYIQSQNRPAHKEENPEIIKAIPIEISAEENQEGSFISYQLPGDSGAHFYFLTPQLAQSRVQGTGYYYSQPKNSRIHRNENKDKER